MKFVNNPTWTRFSACDTSRTAPWPVLSAWLTENEQSALAGWHAPARQTQWLWGRWLSKQLIGNAVGVEVGGVEAVGVESFREIEIITRSEQGLGVRPQVRIAGRPWQGSLSISHTATDILVGLSLDEHISLGVDLACEVPCDERFRSLWFTSSEQQWIAQDPAYRTGLVWGIKEALFKACSTHSDGSTHRWTPTQIEIHPASDGRFEATFFGHPLTQLDVHVQSVARGLAVVVCLPHKAYALADSLPAHENPMAHRPAGVPSDFTLTTASRTERIAAQMPAFDLR